MNNGDLLIFSGTSHPELTQNICKFLNLKKSEVYIGRFPDTEIDIKLNCTVRGADVFVVQSTCTPANEYLIELLAFVDCLKRASAQRVTAVIPYCGYARQDRKDRGRTPISAKLVANLLTTAGIDRVLTVDLHAEQIQGFYDIPVDHLFASPLFVSYLKKLNLQDLVIVSPDVGSLKRARAYANKIGCGLAVVDKRRDKLGKVEMLHLIGEVENKNVVIADDMISSGDTIIQASEMVKRQGALSVYLCATHAVLCGDAVERLRACSAREIIVTDSIPIPQKKRLPNMKVLSLAPYLGETIRRIHNRESISYLFNNFEEALAPHFYEENSTRNDARMLTL